MSLGTDLPGGMFYTGIGLGMIVLGLVGTVLAIKLIFFVIKVVIQFIRGIFGRISGRKVV
jgi:sorbitol-specific phosphotransferase system component IIC